jgi:DNA-binding NarL/FixJ family response regulator
MTIPQIKVAIADDHDMIRIGLERVLTLQKDIVVTAQFRDCFGVMQADLSDVDVLLLDLNMPGVDGLSLLTAVAETNPDLRVIVYSMLPEETFAPRTLAAGAAAFLSKNQAPEEILTAIRSVASRRGQYLTESQEDLLLALEAQEGAPLHQNLSQREFEILLLIAQGKKPTEIAHQLALRIGTVTTHIHRVKRKLAANSLGDLVAYAHSHRLLGG